MRHRHGIYANAFEAEADDGSANEVLTAGCKELGPDRYARMASECIEAGALIVGGWCGIGHDHTACLGTRLRRSSPFRTKSVAA